MDRMRAVAVAVVAVVTAAAIATPVRAAGVPGALADLEYRNLSAALAFGLTAGFLLWRHAGPRIAGLLAVQATAAAVAAWTFTAVRVRLPSVDTAPMSLGLGVHNIVWILLPALVTPLVLIFPSGRLQRRWERGVVLVDALGVAVFVPTVFVPSWGAIANVAIVLLPATMLVAVAAVVRRRRRARGVERAQETWLLFGLVLTAVLFLATSDSHTALSDVVLAASMLPLPVAIGVAVVRYRLFDIDRLLSRTVSYALVLAVIGGVFAVLVVGVSALLPARLDGFAVALATLTVAALFVPVLRRAKRIVDRRFNRSRYDAMALTEQFGTVVRARPDAERIVDDLLGVVSATVAPAHLSVWTPVAPRSP